MLNLSFFTVVYLIKHFNEEHDLAKIEKFACEDPKRDCSGNGICSSDGDECLCFDGYQTYFNDFDDYVKNRPRCNYKSKKQLTALLLGTFLSFGSVHFYLGNYIVGYIQLFLFLLILGFNTMVIAMLSIKHLKKLNRSQIKDSFSFCIVITLLSFVFLFWFTFDLIMVFFNLYKDGNNAPLETFI